MNALNRSGGFKGVFVLYPMKRAAFDHQKRTQFLSTQNGVAHRIFKWFGLRGEICFKRRVDLGRDAFQPVLKRHAGSTGVVPLGWPFSSNVICATFSSASASFF